MIPAAAHGHRRGQVCWLPGDAMAQACAAPKDNPGVMLGVLLGTLARPGATRSRIVASPAIHDLGAWLEQLVAESTGKIGKGLIPVDREPLGAPAVYGNGSRLRVSSV